MKCEYCDREFPVDASMPRFCSLECERDWDACKSTHPDAPDPVAAYWGKPRSEWPVNR
jgi:hypothetical protein